MHRLILLPLLLLSLSGYTQKISYTLVIKNPCDREISSINLYYLSKENQLMHTLDALRQRFGHHTVKYAVQGEKDAVWMLREEHTSACYTTSMDGLLRVTR